MALTRGPFPSIEVGRSPIVKTSRRAQVSLSAYWVASAIIAWALEHRPELVEAHPDLHELIDCSDSARVRARSPSRMEA
jgi:hypothetical protein